MAKLTARSVQTQKVPGLYADGDGLYLQIAPGGSKSWVYRFQRDGRRRELGLGGLAAVSLAEAREKATDARRMLAGGADPIEERRAERAKIEVAEAKALTFEEAAHRYIVAHKTGWRSPKSMKAWEGTLAAFVFPHFGAVAVDAVDVGLVLKAIEPIWAEKPETASRVRGRIEAILDWARARGYRTGENPAHWRGHLENLLPAPAKVRRVQHLAALPYPEIGAFMAELREQGGVAADALQFLVLTAARTGEVIGARWDEINQAERLWSIPAERMKQGRQHQVPLCAPAMAIVEKMAAVRQSEFLFPGIRADRPLSNMSMLMLLRRIKRDDLTVHGFRSTFRDWAGERTSFARDLAEMALSHAIGDKAEAAYRRERAVDRRRPMMEAWGRYCAAPAAGEVVPLRQRRTLTQP